MIPTMSPLHTPSVDENPTAMARALPPGKPSVLERGTQFVRTHWKAIGLVALGLVAWRSKTLRPLVKSAATAYIVPTARGLLSRARG